MPGGMRFRESFIQEAFDICRPVEDLLADSDPQRAFVTAIRQQVAGLPQTAVQFPVHDQGEDEITYNTRAAGVDAVWVVEPFKTALEASQDVVLVLDLFSGPADALPIAGWVVAQEFADSNPNTVAAFLAGLEQATADIEADPGVIAEIVPSYSQVPEEVAAQVSLPIFVAEPDAIELQRVADLMVETGIATEALDVQSELLR